MSVRLTINKNGYYSLRFRINKSLQPYFQKQYIKKSLRTKKRQEAQTKADIIHSQYKKILEVSTMLTDEQIQQMVNSYMRELLEEEKNSRVMNGYSPFYTPAYGDIESSTITSRAMVAEELSERKKDLVHNDLSTIETIGKELLEKQGLTYNSLDKSHRIFMFKLLEKYIDTLEVIEKSFSPDFKLNDYDKYLSQRILIAQTKETQVDKVITLQEAFESFKKWYKRENITDKQYNNTINRLNNVILPFLGFEKNILEITEDDIEDFKEFLESFPNKNQRPYNKWSFTEILSSSENIPENHLISASTQEKYFKVFKYFFKYVDEKYSLPRNPFNLVKAPKANQNTREPFNQEDIQTLFKAFEELDDRKYFYYTVAYTGMRPAEFWKARINYEDDIYYFDLSYDGIELKTRNSKRKIPLHSQLISLGVHKKLKDIQQSFKQDALSKYFNTTILTKLDNTENKVMYSFRHTVATRLKRVDVEMDKISELLGHSYSHSNTTREVYADRYSLKQLKDAIEKLSYS
jgi:integrase